jgi:hypothetical protein
MQFIFGENITTILASMRSFLRQFASWAFIGLWKFHFRSGKTFIIDAIYQILNYKYKI